MDGGNVVTRLLPQMKAAGYCLYGGPFEGYDDRNQGTDDRQG